MVCLSYCTNLICTEMEQSCGVAGCEEGCVLACSVVRDASALDKLGKVKNGAIERFPIYIYLFFFLQFIMDFMQRMRV